MKRSSSSIRGEISKLQEQLRQAETREAERIGRLALRAGVGELDIEEANLQAAFEEIADRFRKGSGTPGRAGSTRHTHDPKDLPVSAGADTGTVGEG